MKIITVKVNVINIFGSRDRYLPCSWLRCVEDVVVLALQECHQLPIEDICEITDLLLEALLDIGVGLEEEEVVVGEEACPCQLVVQLGWNGETSAETQQLVSKLYSRLSQRIELRSHLSGCHSRLEVGLEMGDLNL